MGRENLGRFFFHRLAGSGQESLEMLGLSAGMLLAAGQRLVALLKAELRLGLCLCHRVFLLLGVLRAKWLVVGEGVKWALRELFILLHGACKVGVAPSQGVGDCRMVTSGLVEVVASSGHV